MGRCDLESGRRDRKYVLVHVRADVDGQDVTVASDLLDNLEATIFVRD